MEPATTPATGPATGHGSGADSRSCREGYWTHESRRRRSPHRHDQPGHRRAAQVLRALRRAPGGARLAAAAAAAPQWARSTFEERSRLAVTVAELLEGEIPDIAHVVTTEMGKPFAQAKGGGGQVRQRLPMVRRERRGHAHRRGGGGRRLAGPGHLPAARAVLAIMPWNFPLWQVVRFIAPAVMAGNVGLLKHAPSVPRTALLLEDLFRRAGPPTACSRPC